jgi:hypothetical protein
MEKFNFLTIIPTLEFNGGQQCPSLTIVDTTNYAAASIDLTEVTGNFKVEITQQDTQYVVLYNNRSPYKPDIKRSATNTKVIDKLCCGSNFCGKMTIIYTVNVNGTPFRQGQKKFEYQFCLAQSDFAIVALPDCWKATIKVEDTSNYQRNGFLATKNSYELRIKANNVNLASSTQSVTLTTPNVYAFREYTATVTAKYTYTNTVNNLVIIDNINQSIVFTPMCWSDKDLVCALECLKKDFDKYSMAAGLYHLHKQALRCGNTEFATKFLNEMATLIQLPNTDSVSCLPIPKTEFAIGAKENCVNCYNI